MPFMYPICRRTPLVLHKNAVCVQFVTLSITTFATEKETIPLVRVFDTKNTKYAKHLILFRHDGAFAQP